MYWPTPAIDPVEQCPCQNTQRRFRLALASLSEEEQHLFYLKYYQEIPVKDLATRYGLSTQVISWRLRRITHKLEQADVRQLAG